MVVFVDYEEDSYDDAHHHRPKDVGAVLHSYIQPGKNTVKNTVKNTIVSAVATKYTDTINPARDSAEHVVASQSGTPNLNAFGRCLSCYPVVRELARYLDLNSLDALSRTCLQYRANLMPFRDQLIKRTLRCDNEYIQTLNELLAKGTAIPESLKHVIQLINQDGLEAGRLTSGRVGKCARDMVGECRRCSRVTCRNCTIKPPSAVMLRNRLRRLCTVCCTAPLKYHLSPEHRLSSGIHLSTETWNPQSNHGLDNGDIDDTAFTYPAFVRSPCQCENAVWLCQACGHSLRNDDRTYRRVWTWRTRYSTYLGVGLGTGIGEGCQGVKCGKGKDCLAAQVIEVEVDCEANDSTVPIPNHHNHSHGQNTSNEGDSSSSHQHDDSPGYLRQEIVGIGGVVKQKFKKRVTIGACVEEHEDERESGKYLHREEEGQDRSWCGWCWRVVPSRKDCQV